jgi:hypothetical protein
MLAAAQAPVVNSPDPQLMKSFQGEGYAMQATKDMRMILNMAAQNPTMATGPGAAMPAGIPKAFTVLTPGGQASLPHVTHADAHASPMLDTLPANPMPKDAAGLGLAYPSPETLPAMPILDAPGMLANEHVPGSLMPAVAQHGMATQFAVDVADLTPAKQASVLAMNGSRTTEWLENYKNMLMWGNVPLLPAIYAER